MEYKRIYLKRGKEESLKRFHPWVFSGAIHHADSGIAEGETVRVIGADNTFLAVGHYQVGTIAVRILSFRDVEIDEAFWYARLKAAYEMRLSIGIAGNPLNNTYRLVHGEGDNMPGLVIDCYGDTAVMQAHSVGIHVCRKMIAEMLVKVMEGTIRNVFYKSETTLPYKAELGQENGFIIGGSNDNTAMENGLLFHVDWLRGQKTGFFVDQRENRSLLERYAANVELNFPGDERHKAFCDDAFKFLDNSDDIYDLIILDPPAFAKHRGALHNALKGYTRLNVKAFQRIRHGGILFTFSCSQVVTKDQFRQAVFTAAAMSGRKVRILHQLHQPADHPINIYHPEGEYLKGLVLYVE